MARVVGGFLSFWMSWTTETRIETCFLQGAGVLFLAGFNLLDFAGEFCTGSITEIQGSEKIGESGTPYARSFSGRNAGEFGRRVVVSNVCSPQSFCTTVQERYEAKASTQRMA
jgi:hypothetical protein